MPRPTKYSDEVAARICEGIRLGLTYELAAGLGGVSFETFRQWRSTKPSFLAMVADAEAAGAKENMASIRAAAPTDWRAAAWIMEHRHGYSAKTDLTLGGESTHTVRIVGVDPEDI